MLNQLSILLTHPLHLTKNTFLIANERLSEVATDKFVEAFELLNNCIGTLCKFKCGTDMILSCPLLQAFKAKAAKAKLNRHPSAPQAMTHPVLASSLLTPSANELEHQVTLHRPPMTSPVLSYTQHQHDAYHQ
jgi:hypothetical protein